MTIYPLLSSEDHERFDRYGKLLVGESDRGAAVLAGGYLDSLLEDLLRAVIVEDKSLNSLFDGNGPFATFSGRIDVAFAFGLLPVKTRHDLHLIRKIRNHFAHHSDEVSFTSSPVRDWCKELNATKRGATMFQNADEWIAEPRSQFIFAVQFAMFRLNKSKYRSQRMVVPIE